MPSEDSCSWPHQHLLTESLHAAAAAVDDADTEKSIIISADGHRLEAVVT